MWTIKPWTTVLGLNCRIILSGTNMTAHGGVSLGNRVLAIAKGAPPLLCLVVFIVMLSAEANAEPNEDILAAAKAGD